MLNNNHFGARWANKDEIFSSTTHVDLGDTHIKTAGLPVIVENKTVNLISDDTHSLIIGGTGSKKNRLILFLTTLLLANADESMLIFDPKGETYKRTASYMKSRGYNVKVMDFRSIGNGDFWNPLKRIYNEYRQGDMDKAQSLISDFVSTISASQRHAKNADPFWADMASSLAKSILKIMADICSEDEMNVKTFGHICSGACVEDLEMLAEKLPQNCTAAIELKSVCQSPEKTKSSIYVSLFAMVATFLSQESLSDALSNSTFEFKELTEKKSALYIITPDEKETFNFIVSLAIEELYEVLVETAQDSKGLSLKRRFNFILDEFCNLPEIPNISNMISAARSRNIRFFVAIQSLNQLYAKYDKNIAENIIGNCSNIAYLYSREMPLLKMISEMCGERYLLDGKTIPLITTSQLQRLSKEKGEILFLCGRNYPYISTLPDIDSDALACFKCPPSYTQKGTMQPAKILSLRQVNDDIDDGLRPIPFSKDRESFDISKVKKGDEKYDQEFKEYLAAKFDELFGTDDDWCN